LNERNTFVAAAIVADLVTSVVYYSASPTSALCAASPGLLSYVGQQVSIVTVLWLLVLTAAWLALGQRLIRPRQNFSTKLRVLGWLGMVGLVIEAIVSVYLFSNASDALTSRIAISSIAVELLIRSALYAGIFAVTVLVGYQIGRTQKSTLTPPPRFGRE